MRARVDKTQIWVTEAVYGYLFSNVDRCDSCEVYMDEDEWVEWEDGSTLCSDCFQECQEAAK